MEVKQPLFNQVNSIPHIFSHILAIKSTGICLIASKLLQKAVGHLSRCTVAAELWWWSLHHRSLCLYAKISCFSLWTMTVSQASPAISRLIKHLSQWFIVCDEEGSAKCLSPGIVLNAIVEKIIRAFPPFFPLLLALFYIPIHLYKINPVYKLIKLMESFYLKLEK